MKQTNYHLFDFMDFDPTMQREEALWKAYAPTSIVERDGDIVVTSGENNNYMRDLAIGSISKITVLDYNSSLDIELTPIIDFSRLENVVVVNMSEINSAKVK